MPYQSPNIVIVPTISLVKKKGVHTQDGDHSEKESTTSASAIKPSANTLPKVNTLQSSKASSDISKVSTEKGTVSMTEVARDSVNKTSANREDSRKIKKPSVSWASNYLQSIGPNTNAKPIKANVLSTSNDVIKQTVNSKAENKCGREIKINLLSRPKVTKTVDPSPLLYQTQNSISVVKPRMETLSSPSQLETPTNRNIDSRLCMDTSWNCSSLLQTPMSMNCRQSWPRSNLLETTPNLYTRSCMDTTWNCPPQLQPPTNLSIESRPCLDTTGTCFSQIQTPTNLHVEPSSNMSTAWACSPQMPVHSNFITNVEPRLWPQPQKFLTNTIHRPDENNHTNNSTDSLVYAQETALIKNTLQDNTSSSFKSCMDYTWLTRAHYANINQPNKNNNKVNEISLSTNTKKYNTIHTEFSDKKPANSALVSGRDNKLPQTTNVAKCKKYSDDKILKSETNTKTQKLDSIKSVCLKKIKDNEKREKEKSELRKEIKLLETKIKKLTSDQKPFKIPKLFDSKKDELKRCKAETSVQKQIIKKKVKKPKKLSDKSEKKEQPTHKKFIPSLEHTYRKHICHYLKNNEDFISKKGKVSHSHGSVPQYRRRESETKNTDHPKSTKITKANKNNEKEDKRLGIASIVIDKSKNRSEKDEPQCSKRLQKKRKSCEFSYESIEKKRSRNNNHDELENINSDDEISPVKSVVMVKKSEGKHPRVQAPDSNDSDDDFESDFDLRSKLSQINYKRHIRDKMTYQTGIDQTEKPREKLMITVNRNDFDKSTTLSKPGPSIQKEKSKKYKKIRLVINVIQEEDTSDSSSDDSKDTIVNSANVTNESFAKRNLDLSFLDDFNIDEIVNSLKHNPIPDTVEPNIKQNIEFSKMSTELVRNKFVQPIIIKKEIKNEPVDPEMQSVDIISQESTLDNASNSEYLKTHTHEQSSENILSEGTEIIHNIKKEKHEDQTEKIYKDKSITDIAYLQTSLSEEIHPNVNQINKTVVEDAQTHMNIPGVVELIRDIKPEPRENYNQNDVDENPELQYLLVTNKRYNLTETKGSVNTQVSPDLSNKESRRLEPQESCEYSTSEKNLDHTNWHNVHETVVQENVEEENNNTIKFSSGDRIILTETIQSELNGNIIESELATNNGAVHNVAIKSNNKIKVTSEVVKTTNINEVNRTKTMKPSNITVGETELGNNVLDTSKVVSKKNYETKNCDKVIASTNMKLVNVAETIQSKVEKATEGVLEITKDNVIIEDNSETKISSGIAKATNIKDSNIPKTIQPDVKEKSFDDTLLNISDTLIENNDVREISSDVVKSLSIEDVTVTTKQKIEKNPAESIPLFTSDVIAKDKNENKKPIKRIVSIMPSLKSNEVLGFKLEEKILEHFNLKLDVISEIHQGKFSKNFQCKDENGKNYALKILNANRDQRRFGFQKEIMWNELQKDVPKENLSIVYLIHGFCLDHRWCFLMEYYPQNLQKVLGKFQLNNMDTVQELAKQLASAILMIRSNNIVHSDINPRHILLNADCTNLKVCGFDAAYNANDNIPVLPNIGTVHYRAPEIILGHSAGFSIDVWAAAAVIYEMAAGTKLFNTTTTYNSNMLFQQMCLCGKMPADLIQNSRDSSRHFVGPMFKRVVGPRGEHVLYNMYQFIGKMDMFKILSAECNKKWSKFRTISQQQHDNAKLFQMGKLLDKMLVLDPQQRIPIEFVYADPFFLHKK